MNLEIEGLAGLGNIFEGLGELSGADDVMDGLGAINPNVAINTIRKFLTSQGNTRLKAQLAAIENSLRLNRLTVQLWKAELDLAKNASGDPEIHKRIIDAASRQIVALRKSGVVA